MDASEKRFDVVIVGGGPVGLAMALSLVRFVDDLKIGLVDRRPFAVPRDQRASALSAAVRRVLEAIGVWGQVASEAQPISKMTLTDSGSGDISRPVLLNFDGEVAPGEPFAQMVPNTVLNNALLEALTDRVELISPVEVSGFGAEGANGVVTLGDGRRLVAPLVIAADGQQSGLRGFAGIGTVNHDYHQVGIVTTITHELDHEGVAYEHFRPAGPFASLPLPGGRSSSLVWTETPEAAARYKAMPLDAVALEIEAVMGSVLGTVTVEQPLQSFPLRMQIARELVAPRLALIGDAAHVVHPIAGQGLNLGLKDVAALAEAVIEAMRLGLDHGSPDVLARYSQWRRFDTSLMAMVTDGMNRLFSNDIAPVRALRDVGLGLVERVPPVKEFLIRSAAGIGGPGPRLLSGYPI